MRITLVNPNSNRSTTQQMLALAQQAAGSHATLDALTAGFGAPLICDEAALAVAADAVLALLPTLVQSRPNGVIIAAFGDPGRAHLSGHLACPVIGIAQAAMAEAAIGGRRFCVVTTTPDLVSAIMCTARGYGLGRECLGVRLTPGDPGKLMADAAALEQALLVACEAAVRENGAEAIVIGGGPLAVAARALAGRLPVPVIEPVPAAVRRVLAELAGGGQGVDQGAAGAGAQFRSIAERKIRPPGN